MIFKYFLYNKPTKEWNDTKSYYSMCIPNYYIRKQELPYLLHKSLLKYKIINFDVNHLAISDYSDPYGRIFGILHRTTTRHITLGKLIQLSSLSRPHETSQLKTKKKGFDEVWTNLPNAPNTDYWIDNGGFARQNYITFGAPTMPAPAPAPIIDAQLPELVPTQIVAETVEDLRERVRNYGISAPRQNPAQPITYTQREIDTIFGFTDL